ncbi:MAG TPA: helix-turn-helix transcriptional regulator, partial [Bryobacteraceae bacterium]
MPRSRRKPSDPRITFQGLRVLDVFMENVAQKYSGADVAQRTELLSGSLYPILIRYEQAGWLTSRWEKEEPAVLGRPRRRLYRITGAGQ